MSRLFGERRQDCPSQVLGSEFVVLGKASLHLGGEFVVEGRVERMDEFVDERVLYLIVKGGRRRGGVPVERDAAVLPVRLGLAQNPLLPVAVSEEVVGYVQPTEVQTLDHLVGLVLDAALDLCLVANGHAPILVIQPAS